MDQLKNLGFICNCTKGTAYHTLTTGDTLLAVDNRSAGPIAADRTHTAGCAAGSLLMGNCIVRTYRFTFTATNTFALINDRLAIYGADRPSRAYNLTRMCYTPHTTVCYTIFIFRAGITCRGNHLDHRRLVIFFVNIALLQPLCHMHRCIFRAKRQPHRKPDLLSYYFTLPVNAFPINRSFRIHNFIG